MVEVVSRFEWRARPPTSRSTIPLPVSELWLHHSAVERTGAGQVRSIQSYHMDIKGWTDVGYSWLYDPAGRTFYEGRGAGVAGAHTQGHNRTGHALCVLGNFDSQRVAQTTVSDLAAFAAWHRQYGPGEFTGGHRDVGTTSCPGSNLYRLLPDINTAARAYTEDDEMPLTPDDARLIAGEVWNLRLKGGATAGNRLDAIDTRTAKLLSRESAEKTADELGCDPEDVLNALHRRLAE